MGERWSLPLFLVETELLAIDRSRSYRLRPEKFISSLMLCSKMRVRFQDLHTKERRAALTRACAAPLVGQKERQRMG